MKFIADRMLGSLARWLRTGGQDVFYDRDICRSSLIRIAKQESRLILTRANNFRELSHIPPFLLIKSEFTEEQLQEMLEKFPKMDLIKEAFTRCIRCNVLLKKVSKTDVKKRVPPKAYTLHKEYKICPSCNRIYWPGTHVERMKKFLVKVG